MSLVLVGTALGHTGRHAAGHAERRSGSSSIWVWCPTTASMLPLGFGLVATLGWLLVCLAFQGDRWRTIALAYAGGALA